MYLEYFVDCYVMLVCEVELIVIFKEVICFEVDFWEMVWCVGKFVVVFRFN